MKKVIFIVCVLLFAGYISVINLYADMSGFELSPPPSSAEVEYSSPNYTRWVETDSSRPDPYWTDYITRSIVVPALTFPEGATLIALTFDDGPSSHTSRLLDALNARGARATFFTTGRAVNANPHIAARIVSEGHEIACHAHTHPLLTNLSADAIRRELTNSRNAIYNATGVFPALFRPPYGGQNSTVRSVAAEFNMPLIFWNIDTEDWRSRNAQAILRTVVTANGTPRVRDGDIILMHDTVSATVEATIQIIDQLQARGFYFVTVSQLFEARGRQLVPGVSYRSAR